MPDREVRTYRDLINYQYAKLVARSAFRQSDGTAAKKAHYGFIKKTFRELRDGKKTWSDIEREDWQLVDAERTCAYCGAAERLSHEHLVAKSLRINDRCPTCDAIQSIHNQVLACRRCNSEKGTKGLYEFTWLLHPDDRKHFDRIPPLVEKKYLKTIIQCLGCAGVLDQVPDVGRQISVLDLDEVLRAYCR